MPKMLLKVEGKGNGIKTNIVNLADIAKALQVPTDCTKNTILFPQFNCSKIFHLTFWTGHYFLLRSS